MKINQGILFGDIIWDKEDLKVDGNTYFTYDEALKIQETFFPEFDLKELFKKNSSQQTA